MIAIIIFWICFPNVHNLIIRKINDEWKFSHPLTHSEEFETNVPNGIFSDLYKNYLIEDIFSFNDSEYKILLESDEKTYYYRHFTMDEELKNASNVELVFYGIDGTGQIFFNDKILGLVSNTFVRYRFNITNKLQDKNKITIIFDGPIKKASELSTIFRSYNLSRQRNKHNIAHVHLLRRMQASFGAEWAPAMPSFGIWKDVELVVYENDVVIRDIIVQTFNNISFGIWNLQIDVHFDVPSLTTDNADTAFSSQKIGTFNAFLTDKNGKIITSRSQVLVRNLQSETTLTGYLFLPVYKSKVKQWWPNGYGAQNLYKLTVKYFPFSGPKDAVISKSIQIGFRTIYLDKRPLSVIDDNNNEENRSFHFSVNNAPIFLKGTSFLPVSILPEESIDEEKIDYLLRSAKAAHMNMIRVPASGIYQSDFFYQKCDEYGLLVWQEMMFDTEMYPFRDKQFKQSIIEEMTQQFNRLQYHPSIAIWIANNDLEVTLGRIITETKQKTWTVDYQNFLNIFVNIMQKDKYRPHLTSTPSTPLSTENQNSFLSGDAHIYSISNTWLVEDDEIVPRFVSQYGAWSLPSLESFKEIKLSTRDISSVHTEFMKHRMRRDIGDAYEEITQAILQHFGMPKENFLDAFIYASQITQAWSMKLQTESYRKWSSYVLPQPVNTGFTMGALMWHLNDTWQMPSASSIEYSGKWKMLHYYACHFFAPVTSSLEITSSFNVIIHLISDFKEDTSFYLFFEIFLWSSNNLQPISTLKRTFTIQRISSVEYKNSTLMQYLKSNCDTPDGNITKKCLLKLTIYNKKKEELNTNYLLPAAISLRNISSLPNPNIKVDVISCTHRTCKIVVHTDAIALFVWLDVGNNKGYFSDNGFIMTTPRKEIEFYSEDGASLHTIESSITFKVIGRDYLQQNFDPS